MSFINTILSALFNTILLPIVSSIYGLINWGFQVFLIIGYTNLFGSEEIKDISINLYTILGVVVMFIIAYNILMLIIDPTKDKGGAVTRKLVINIVTSLIAIVICPTLFTYASRFQLSILESNVITQFVYGEAEDNSSSNSSSKIIEGGRLIAGKMWASFYQPTKEVFETNCKNWTSNDSADACRRTILSGDSNSKSLADQDKDAETKGDFLGYIAFTDKILDGKLEWHWLLSIAAGVFVLYIILSYCVEMAERIVKLILYQFLAPICIASRIVPNQDKIFKNWLSALVKTYLAIFIKLFALTLSVYIINVLGSINLLGSVTTTIQENDTYFLAIWAYLFMILGVLLLMKNISKYLEEIFGFKMAGKGLMGSLKDAGFFTAGAALGGGVASAITNFQTSDKKGIQRLGSALGGFGSGAYNGIRNGKDAKDFKSMGSAITKSKDTAYKNKLNREARRARYNSNGENWFTGFVSDKKEAIGSYFGAGLEKYDAEIKRYDQLSSLKNALDSTLESELTKNATNIGYRANDKDIDFKGFDGEGEVYLNQFKSQLGGMSIASMREYLKSEENAPTSRLSEKQKIEKANKIGYLQSYLKQVEDASKAMISDLAMKDSNIVSEKVRPLIRSQVEMINQEFELSGNKLSNTDYNTIKDEVKKLEKDALKAKEESYKAHKIAEQRKNGQ